MTDLDRAFETLMEWKARRLIYTDYQSSVGETTDSRSFKLGAIDAMVYDMASLMGLNRKTPEHANWASYGVRKEFLDRLRQRTAYPPGQAPPG